MPRRKLEKPFAVQSFDGDTRVVIEEAVDVTLYFRPGVVEASFFISAVPHAILGLDLLRGGLGLALDTGDETLRVGLDILITKKTAADSLQEYRRRRKIGATKYRLEYSRYLSATPWMRVGRRVVVGPGEIVSVLVVPDINPEGDHSMFSLYDDYKARRMKLDVSIYIPSLTFEKEEFKEGGYMVPVFNESDKPITMFKDMIIGELIYHLSDLRRTGAECFNLADVLEAIDEQLPDGQLFQGASGGGREGGGGGGGEMRKGGRASVNVVSTEELGEASASASAPVPISELIDVNKVSNEDLERCRKDGIAIDVRLTQPDLGIDVEILEDIDVEAERAKSASFSIILLALRMMVFWRSGRFISG